MAGTIKLDGATFLEKDGGNYKIANTELKLKSSGNTIVDSSGNAVLSESGGNVSIGNLRLPSTGGIKDSSGNDILTESGGNVSIGDMRLPATGGIKDSAGNNVLSESGGVVNLANTVAFTDEYYLSGKLPSSYTSSLSGGLQVNFDVSTDPYWVLTGDTTNFVQGTTISDLKIIRAGIYLVSFTLSCFNTADERVVEAKITGVGSGSTNVLASAVDSISYVDNSSTYGNATAVLVYKFNANDQIGFRVASGAQGDARISASTHFNICLIRPL